MDTKNTGWRGNAYMEKGKVTIAIGFLLVGGYALFEIATRFVEGGMVGGRPQNNAALFPMITAALLLFVTVIWIMQNLRSRETGGVDTTASEQQEGPGTSGSAKPNMNSFWILFILIVYILLVDVIGYLVLTPFALTAMLYVLGVGNLLYGFSVSVATTFVFYYLFGVLMNIILPVGRFGWYI